ncbi:MAG: DUF309 domain-containing protein [Leptolyngbyaceae cyanobacterium bins.59]|nr:DUF309 domain-containing protein [Leptolyngbyaceae cyanobacterium bins.59]
MTTPSIPDEFWQGIEQFNQHQFYACHDTLEALWMEAGEPDRTFYQGILQIAVALYHLHQQNWRGAVVLLGEGSNRLRRYEPDFFDVDVEQLVTDSYDLLTHLQEIGPEKVADLLNNSPSLPTIALLSSPSSSPSS